MDTAKWFSDVKENITNKFTDISSIDVVTAVADEVALTQPVINTLENLKSVELKKMSYYARTSMQMDGDRYTLLPSGDNTTTRDKVQDLHDAHVTSAVASWNNMARVALTGLLIVATLAGVPKSDLSDARDLVKEVGLIK